MAKMIFKSISAILLSLSLVFVSPAFAQTAPTGTTEENAPKGGPRKQLATIVFAGLGGAILGLSTLSFYGRPQDNLANIAVGFAVGIIVGTVYVTYKAASSPAEFYGERVAPEIWKVSQSSQRGYLTDGLDGGTKTPTLNLGLSF